MFETDGELVADDITTTTSAPRTIATIALTSAVAVLDAEQVYGGERHDRANGERAGEVGVDVRAERQGDGRAARGLPDHKGPAGEKAPRRPQPLPAVDVGAARVGIEGGEPRRGSGVAVRDDGGDPKADQEPPTSSRGGRADGREHPGADHRAEPDHDGVEGAEPAREAALRLRRIVHTGSPLGRVSPSDTRSRRS